MNNQKKQKKENTTFRKFLKFSGIGVQLGVMMFLASKLGNLVDEYYQFKKPWITLLFIILALVIFVMNLMRQLNKLNNE